MINGILKLFYTEIVKNKIKNLPQEEYEIKDKFKKVQDISCKVDLIAFRVFKYLIGVFIFILSLKINIYFGIGVFFVELLYIIYKNSFKVKVETEVSNIKNNIKTNSQNILREKGQRNISILISLLFLGIIFDFTWIVIVSFFIVFIDTIRIVYINYKT